MSGLAIDEAGPSQPAAAATATPAPADSPSNTFAGLLAEPSGAGAVNTEMELPSSGLFPGMPMNMDMDFDDEEGYSDEDYDAEVFEDEMEEELSRPQEKVVNMSVAPGELLHKPD